VSLFVDFHGLNPSICMHVYVVCHAVCVIIIVGMCFHLRVENSSTVWIIVIVVHIFGVKDFFFFLGWCKIWFNLRRTSVCMGLKASVMHL
jgi:hypothetical protein